MKILFIILAILLFAFIPSKNTFKEVKEIGHDGKVILFNALEVSKLSANHLIIADKAGYRLMICDTSLKFQKYYGRKGKTLGEFNGPSQMATNKSIIVISDFASSRIQVFTKELKPIKEFYAEGPVFDMAFSKSGNLLVGAYTGGENTLYKYDLEFKKYKTIKLKNLKGDMFNDIYKINILENGIIAVAYLTQNIIELLDSDGRFIKTIIIKDLQSKPNYLIEKGLKIPEGLIIGSITSDSLSNIWVLVGNYSIAPKQEIFIYSSEGKLLHKTIFPNKIEDIFIDKKSIYTIESNRTIIKKYITTGV